MTVLSKVIRLDCFNCEYIYDTVQDLDVVKREDRCKLYEYTPNGKLVHIHNLFYMRHYLLRLSTQEIIPLKKDVLYKYTFVTSVEGPNKSLEFIPAPRGMIEHLAFETNESFAHGSRCIKGSVLRKFEYGEQDVRRLGCECLLKVIRAADGSFVNVPAG